MFDGVLDEWLKNHARDDQVGRAGFNLLTDLQFRTEPDDLDVEIFVDRVELFAERHEVLVTAKEAAEQSRQLVYQRSRRLRLRSNQRRNRRERVEQEVRIDLALE